jgi:hypothetical protein
MHEYQYQCDVTLKSSRFLETTSRYHGTSSTVEVDCQYLASSMHPAPSYITTYRYYHR